MGKNTPATIIAMGGRATMVKEKLIEALENAGFDVFQANAIPATVPDTYVTFYVQDTYDVRYFDNRRVLTNWVFEVKYYDNNPRRMESRKYEIRKVLTNAGFVADGIGYDILISNENNKLGWECDFDFIEKCED